MTKKLNIKLFCMFLIVIMTSATIHADTHYVALNGAHVSPYTNWVDAATNIQDAINSSQVGETVLVTNGTYTLSSQLLVNKSISLYSVNNHTNTILTIVANTTNRIMRISDSTNVIINGFTFLNGLVLTSGGIYDGGGAILVTNCLNTTIEFCKINKCTAILGATGGAYLGGTAITVLGVINVLYIKDSVIENCYNTSSGAGRNGIIGSINYNKTIILTNSIFRLNTNTTSGFQLLGIKIANSTISNNVSSASSIIRSSLAINSIFVGNNDTAVDEGVFDGGEASNCIFIANAGNTGAGTSHSTNYYCTFKNNYAYASGGGVHHSEVYNSTFISNQSAVSGTAAYQSKLYNCLVYGHTNNTANAGHAVDTGTNINCTVVNNYGRNTAYALYNSYNQNCIIYNNTGGGNINGGTNIYGFMTNPSFADTTYFRLKSTFGTWSDTLQTWVQYSVNSPCIDTGDRINIGYDGNTPQASKYLTGTWKYTESFQSPGKILIPDM